MLNVVCNFPNDLFEAEHLQQALDMAVQRDCALNVAKLAKGAHKLPNIDEALSWARKIRAFGVYTVLLMLQAAYADNSQLVLALFGKDTAAVPITSDPDFPRIEAVLHDKEFPINAVLKVAQQVGSRAFCTAVESISGMRSHSNGCHDGNAKIQDHPSRNGGDNMDLHDLPGGEESRGAVSDRLLHRYCREGNTKKVKELVSALKANKVNIKARLHETLGFFSYTPLHEAASTGHADVLELLLKEQGPVNAKASSLYTPLHLAASGGYSECARLLLQYGADLTAKDEYQRTPLHTAEVSARTGVVKVLKSYGELHTCICTCRIGNTYMGCLTSIKCKNEMQFVFLPISYCTLFYFLINCSIHH